MRAWEQGSNQTIWWFYSIFCCTNLGACFGESTDARGGSGQVEVLHVGSECRTAELSRKTSTGVAGVHHPQSLFPEQPHTGRPPDFDVIGEKHIFSENSKYL